MTETTKMDSIGEEGRRMSVEELGVVAGPVTGEANHIIEINLRLCNNFLKGISDSLVILNFGTLDGGNYCFESCHHSSMMQQH